jgi:hypothetical protein
MEYSGAGGKLIHEKNQKQKISWHYPFKGQYKLNGAFIIYPVYKEHLTKFVLYMENTLNGEKSIEI